MWKMLFARENTEFCAHKWFAYIKLYLTFWVLKNLLLKAHGLRVVITRWENNPMAVFLFPRAVLSQAFTSYLLVFNCSLSESAQEIQGVGAGGGRAGKKQRLRSCFTSHWQLSSQHSALQPSLMCKSRSHKDLQVPGGTYRKSILKTKLPFDVWTD